MPIDLQHTPTATALAQTTRRFIQETVLPLEEQFDGDITQADGDRFRLRVQEQARQAGIFAPHGPPEFGGQGLDLRDRAPVFEEAGYSVFGPTALHIAAPDEGNIHMLDRIADPQQRERYLAPLARGELRSAFAMTEPAPGAGADPSALLTTADRDTGGWRINGRKTFITGADGAGFFIIMARTSGSPGDRGGATMFLAPAGTPGLNVGRHINTMDTSMLGGHCEVTFQDLRLGPEAVLGEVDEGFTYAQVRLGPARMTHVMRWLGTARRAQDIAAAQCQQRHLFGSRLGDLGLAQKMLADNEIDIAATRALLLQACHELDKGEQASMPVSVAKAFGAEAIDRVVDRSIQLCGGLGVSDELPLARLAREVRPFRIYDGPTEVHRWSIAKKVASRARRALRGLRTEQR